MTAEQNELQLSIEEEHHADIHGNRGALSRLLGWCGRHLLPRGRLIKRLEERRTLYQEITNHAPTGYILVRGTEIVELSDQLKTWLGSEELEELGDFIDVFALKEQATLRREIDALFDGMADELEQTLSLKTSKDARYRLIGRMVESSDISDLKIEHEGEESGLLCLWVSPIKQKVVTKTKDSPKDVLDKQSLDVLSFPVWLRDNKGNLVWGNSEYRRAVGVAESKIAKEQLEILGSKVDVAKNLAKQARDLNKPVTEEYHTIVNGDRALLEITETPLVDGRYTIGHATDHTQIENISEELTRFRSSTSELLKSLNTGIAIFDPQKHLSFYNDAFSRLFELEDVWLNTRPVVSEIVEAMRQNRRLPEQADFKEYKQTWSNMFTDLIGPHEDMMHLPDGTALRLVVVPHPMGGLFMTFEDVTSRLELESNYNTLIAVQQETLNNLAEGLAVFGTDGRLQLFNPVYAGMWDLDDAFLEGLPHISEILDKVKEDLDSERWPDIEKELRSAALIREERIGRLFLDDHRVLEYVTVPLPDGGMLSRFLDVTDTLRVEQALIEKNAALEEAERLKLDFLANVSYQLRTPLNAMMGFAEVLDNQYFGEINERQREYTKGMINAGEKLISLINDILDLSTIEAGYLELQLSEFGVHDTVKSIYDLTREWAGQHSIDLKMECPKNIGRIKADERRLKQVLLNLVSNAIKFTPAKGTIKIKVVRSPGHIHFVVKDSGIGISKGDQDKIFTPFVQVRKKNNGAGLGLTLVKKVVELHGGEISMESNVGEGTRVTCKFPISAKPKKPRKNPSDALSKVEKA